MKRRIILLAVLLSLIAVVAVACAIAPLAGGAAPQGQPASAQASIAEGFAALRQQDWQAAQQAFSAGLQIEPQRSEALTGRGWAWLGLGELASATTSMLHWRLILKMLRHGPGVAGPAWSWATTSRRSLI